MKAANSFLHDLGEKSFKRSLSVSPKLRSSLIGKQNAAFTV